MGNVLLMRPGFHEAKQLRFLSIMQSPPCAPPHLQFLSEMPFLLPTIHAEVTISKIIDFGLFHNDKIECSKIIIVIL